MRKTLTYLFLTLFFSLPQLMAQKNSYQLFSNITVDKETSVITCFNQDRQGMIWIGSDKGLYSYDGYSALSHFRDSTNRDSWIYSMEIIDGRYIYIGADNGVMIYDIEKDAYVDSKVKFPSDIRALLYVDGKLWIGTLQGLYQYDVRSSRLDKIDITKNNGIPHSTIYSIISSEDGNIYIGTYNGLCLYEPSSKKFVRINLPECGKERNLFVNSLQEDCVRKCIWIGTEERLLRYFPANGQVEAINDIHTNSIKSLSLDCNGTLLVGTDNGLFTYSESGVRHVLHDSRNVQSLSNNVIWDIFRDRDGNMWLGSNSGISFVHSDNYFRNIPLYQITGTGDGKLYYKGDNIKDDATLAPGTYTFTVDLINGTYTIQ